MNIHTPLSQHFYLAGTRDPANDGVCRAYSRAGLVFAEFLKGKDIDSQILIHQSDRGIHLGLMVSEDTIEAALAHFTDLGLSAHGMGWLTLQDTLARAVTVDTGKPVIFFNIGTHMLEDYAYQLRRGHGVSARREVPEISEFSPLKNGLVCV
jgi:hypothetical protein